MDQAPKRFRNSRSLNTPRPQRVYSHGVETESSRSLVRQIRDMRHRSTGSTSGTNPLNVPTTNSNESLHVPNNDDGHNTESDVCDQSANLHTEVGDRTEVDRSDPTQRNDMISNSNNTENNDVGKDDVDILQKSIDMWDSPSSLLAVLLTRGGTSYSKQEYFRLASLLNLTGKDTEYDKLPSFETLRQGIFPFLMKNIIPGVLHVKIQSRTPDEVGIVPPSVWASIDIMDPVFMYHFKGKLSSTHSFEKTPFNTDRKDCMDAESVFDTTCKYTSHRFRKGDIVNITLDNCPKSMPLPTSSRGSFLCQVENVTSSTKITLPHR